MNSCKALAALSRVHSSHAADEPKEVAGRDVSHGAHALGGACGHYPPFFSIPCHLGPSYLRACHIYRGSRPSSDELRPPQDSLNAATILSAFRSPPKKILGSPRGHQASPLPTSAPFAMLCRPHCCCARVWPARAALSLPLMLAYPDATDTFRLVSRRDCPSDCTRSTHAAWWLTRAWRATQVANFELVMDIIFIIDIALNFRTAYVADAEVRSAVPGRISTRASAGRQRCVHPGFRM